MKQLKAVEWLEKQLTTEQWNELQDILYKAKQMEKQSIENAFGVGCQVESTGLIGYQQMAEQYYNETYKKEE